MPWDIPKPFILNIAVQPAEIDALGHVNNVVYVSWLEQCAWQHSKALGVSLEDYQRLDRAMVVIRHEIDYLASAHLGDELLLGTWIVESDQRLKMRRQFQLLRPADGCTLVRATTTFVCIELSSSKPKRMPALFSQAYGRALHSKTLAE